MQTCRCSVGSGDPFGWRKQGCPADVLPLVNLSRGRWSALSREQSKSCTPLYALSWWCPWGQGAPTAQEAQGCSQAPIPAQSSQFCTDPRNFFSGMCPRGRGFRHPSMQPSPRPSRCGGFYIGARKGDLFDYYPSFPPGGFPGLPPSFSWATPLFFFAPRSYPLPAQRCCWILGGLRTARLTGGARTYMHSKKRV